MRWLLFSVGVLVFLFAFRSAWDRAASRGWVYARGEAPRRGNLVGGLGFEQVFEPEYEHVYEEQATWQVEADQDAAGEGR